MVNKLTLVVLLTLFLDSSSPDVWARGRSFPQEATGMITSVEKRDLRFTLATDEPARILTLAVGDSCKFSHTGAPAHIGIIRKHAYVKVSFFSAMFTGRVAVDVESDPVPQVAIGIVEKIDTATRKLVIRLSDSSRRLVVLWAAKAQFVKRGRAASVRDLRENRPIKLSYYAPDFASKYAVRIEMEPSTRF